MKKKISLLAFASILFWTTNQHAYAQTCTGDKVLVSKGCVCGLQRGQRRCESKCVDPNHVQHYLDQGWYLGACDVSCCPVFKIDSKAHSTALRDTLEASIAQTKFPLVKCNCNCSLPNYGLSNTQLKKLSFLLLPSL